MKKIALAAVLGVALFAVPTFAQSPRFANRNFNNPGVPVMPANRTFTAPQIAPVNSYYYLQPMIYNQAAFGTPFNYGLGAGYNYTRFGVATTPWGLSTYTYGGIVQPNLGLYSPALWGAAYGMPYGIGFGW